MVIEQDGNVGIGTESPTYELDVAGNIGIDEHIYHNGDADTYIAFSAQNTINLVANGYSFLKYDGTIRINNANRDRDTQVMADDGNVVLHIDAGTNMVGIGTTSPDYTLDVAGNIGIDEYIKHNGDSDTYIRFEADEINIVAGDATLITAMEGGGGAQADKVTINDGATDVDFQVKGDNEANLIRTDAANDRVGIGTSAPDCRLHVTGAAGDLFKMENSTAYGITYGQLVKESLTLTDSGSPIDTTLDLPAASVIEDVLITVKTVAVGTTFNITNVALTALGQTSNIKGSSFSSIDMTNNGGVC